MALGRLKQGITNRTMRYINERRGWKTNRKIIVIESDDWGSIRMPDREVYEKMILLGLRVDLSTYNKYDTLASKEDFEHLYAILKKHKDKNNNHPVITANTLVANPDFDKIRNSNFENYYYESFLETLKKYPDRGFESWQEGMKEKIFFPQLHGREHLNVSKWMNYLQKPSKEIHFAFEHGLYGIGSKISIEHNPSFVQAFESKEYLEAHSKENIINDGVQLFQEIFGFSTSSFIAPNYIWDNELEEILSRNQIKYIQGTFIQRTPENSNRYHFLGEKNEFNQLYLVRNVIFEPASNENFDWVNKALKEINQSFKYGKPAIISMHRVNFIGSIFKENRTRNLKLFDKLLKEVIKKWPEIEFMTSVELGDLINKDSIFNDF